MRGLVRILLVLGILTGSGIASDLASAPIAGKEYNPPILCDYGHGNC